MTVVGPRSSGQTSSIFALWRSNFELFLAAITLVALLIGWLGGGVTGWLPGWAIATAAVVAFVAGGYSGMMGAIEEAKAGKLDIDFLMIAAAIGAAAIGEWEEGALLLFLFTLSGALEEFAMERTRKAIEALADLRPDVARIRRNGEEATIAVDELHLGDVVLVRPGERLPVDGVVTKGVSSIDQSPITGESIPVRKEVQDQVFAGTINGSGALEITVEKLAGESTLSKIIRLVEEAQQDTTPTQKFIDRFSQPYTYAVIGATLLAVAIPWFFANEPFSDTLYRAMTLLVVASPCALISSTPASVLSAIAAG
ncbi:MAG: HAD-IC family P-type ATPase, partial [Caldilineaceae bacterium]|nr:HAD-IC family P-type ATPase [Caldilineaceae bacterium]